MRKALFISLLVLVIAALFWPQSADPQVETIILRAGLHGDAQRVSTVAALSGLTVADNDYVVVSGYNAPNDGGGQVVVYDADSAATVNGGSVFNGPGGVGRFLGISETENVRLFGAVAGSGDDTAAFQAAIDAAVISGRYVCVPAGQWHVGPLTVTTAGAAGTPTFVSIIGPGSALATLRYTGSTSGTALTISFNKRFLIHGLTLQNTVAKGTTTGVLMTGPNDTGGTQTLGGKLSDLIITGFSTNAKAGAPTDRAASEIYYEAVNFDNCDYGWVDGAGNSLNHVFEMCGFTGCGTAGVYSQFSNVTIYGGSASGNAIDFKFGAHSSSMVQGFRSETANLFVEAFLGYITIDSCLVAGASDPGTYPDQIKITSAAQVIVRGSRINGRVKCAAGGISLAMHDNAVIGDNSTGLPFFMGEGNTVKYSVNNNIAFATASTGAGWYDDETGEYLAGKRLRSLANQNRTAYLNRIASLSQGSETRGKNLRVRATFASSGTVAVAFARTVTAAIGNGDNTMTVAAGGLTDADVGKRVTIAGAYGGGDLVTAISSVTNSTTCEMDAYPTITNASISATIGENEPDDKYFLFPGGNAQETFSWSNKATTGFTLTSSNASSTATVDVMVVR